MRLIDFTPNAAAISESWSRSFPSSCERSKVSVIVVCSPRPGRPCRDGCPPVWSSQTLTRSRALSVSGVSWPKRARSATGPSEDLTAIARPKLRAGAATRGKRKLRGIRPLPGTRAPDQGLEGSGTTLHRPGRSAHRRTSCPSTLGRDRSTFLKSSAVSRRESRPISVCAGDRHARRGRGLGVHAAGPRHRSSRTAGTARSRTCAS